MTLTKSQEDKLRIAMDKYQLYDHTKVSTFTSIDIENVKAVRRELNNDYEFCRTCLGELVDYMRNTYETIWIK